MNRNNRKFDSDDRPIMTLVYVLVVVVVIAGSAGFFFVYQKKDTNRTVQQEEKLADQEQADNKQGTYVKADGSGDSGTSADDMAQTETTKETTIEEISEAENKEGEMESSSEADAEETAIVNNTEEKTGEDSEQEEAESDESQTEESTEAGTQETSETESVSEGTSESVSETESGIKESSDSGQNTLPDYKDALGAYTVSASVGFADEAGAEAGSVTLIRNLVVAVTAQQDVDGVVWDQVEYYGLTGWIEDSNLARLGEGQKLADSTGAYIYTEPGYEVSVYDKDCSSEERAAIDSGENVEVTEAGKLGYGNEVTVEEAEGNWVKITSGEITGWVQAAAVAMYLPDTYYYADPDVNLRSEPNLDASKVGTLTKGTTVKITVFQNGWAEIQSGSQTGWAALYYLTPCEDSNGGSVVQTTAPASTANSSQGTSGGSSSSGSSGSGQPSTNSGTGTGGSETPSTPSDSLNWVSDDTLDWE